MCKVKNSGQVVAFDHKGISGWKAPYGWEAFNDYTPLFSAVSSVIMPCPDARDAPDKAAVAGGTSRKTSQTRGCIPVCSVGRNLPWGLNLLPWLRISICKIDEYEY